MKRLLLTLGIIVAFILVSYYEGQLLKRNHHLTTALIIECDGGGKGNWGPGIHYEYSVNKKIIKSSMRKGELQYSIQPLNGHSFPVIYKKRWFGYNDVILITPNDFAYYGYDFPDSLNWVIKYLKK